MKFAVAASTHYNALMMQRLGDELDLAFTNYETDPAKQPVWEVAGIDPKMIAHFSKRRAGARPRYEQLREAYRQAHGRTPGLRASRKLWQQAVLDTRPSKDAAHSLQSLRQTWQAEARQFFGNSATDAVEKNVSHAADTRTIAPAVDSDGWGDFVTEQAESAIALAVSRRSEFRRHHLHTAVEQELSAWIFPSQRARALATAHVMDRALESAVRLTPQPSYRIPGRLLTEDGELFDGRPVSWSAWFSLRVRVDTLASWSWPQLDCLAISTGSSGSSVFRYSHHACRCFLGSAHYH